MTTRRQMLKIKVSKFNVYFSTLLIAFLRECPKPKWRRSRSTLFELTATRYSMVILLLQEAAHKILVSHVITRRTSNLE
jgi:hypothetical protein